MKKTIPTILFVGTAFFISSCSSRVYQVIETTSPQATSRTDSTIYENAEIRLSYDFWTSGGQVQFQMFNKLESPIYVNLDHSHLILNGLSYEYWNDSEESSSINRSESTGSSSRSRNAFVNLITGTPDITSNYQSRRTSTTTTSTIRAKRIIQIPPRSAISVSEFSISDTAFYDSDINLKGLNGKVANTKSYNSINSPLRFRNYITYATEPSFARSLIVDNEFYISKISFVTEKQFQGRMKTVRKYNINGTKINSTEPSYPFRNSNSYFIELRRR